MIEEDQTLYDYWRIISYRKWTIFISFVVVFVLTVFYTKVQVPVYQSKLELQVEKENTQAAPSLMMGIAEEPNLTSEIRMIKNFPTIKHAVENVELLPVDAKERERKINTLVLSYQQRIHVKQIPGTNILSLRVKSNDPDKAALMANAVADAFIQENIEGRRKRARKVLEYTDNQIEGYQKSLNEMEGNLQKFKQTEKVFLVTENVKKTLDRLTLDRTFEFETQMLTIQSQLEEINKILEYRGTLSLEEFLKVYDIQKNIMLTSLKRRLLEKEFERFLMLVDYTSKHPKVVAQDNAIQQSKTKIVAIIKKSINRKFTSEMDETLSIVLKKLFLENRAEVLFRIINKSYGDIGSLSPNQLEFQELNRNIDSVLKAYNELLTKKEEMKLAIAEVVDDVVTVILEAKPPARPIKPKAKVNYIVGALLGLIIGLFLSFIQESLDKNIYNPEDLEERANVSVLGTIPLFENTSNADLLMSGYQENNPKKLRESLITLFKPSADDSEQFRVLRANFLQNVSRTQSKVVLLTSSKSGEGKATIGANLAISLAQLAKKTLIIDANLRDSRLDKFFGLISDPGLVDVLNSRLSCDESIRSSSDIILGLKEMDAITQIPGLDNLFIMTAGQKSPNPSELLGSHQMQQLIEYLRKHYDYVVIIAPPTFSFADVSSLASVVDTSMVICRSGHVQPYQLSNVVAHLKSINSNFLGVVLNGAKVTKKKRNAYLEKLANSFKSYKANT